jgi:putative ABC transport system ATP-binding protein
MIMSILKVADLSRMYGEDRITTWALRDITFTVEEGEFIGIMGPSGSGKTTLLNLLAAIDSPTSGSIEIGGIDLSKLSGRGLAIFRRRNLGFVFQDYNLLPTLSIRENVILPLALDGVSPSVIHERLWQVATDLGIEPILDKRVFQVSGGEQQRAAIARAIIHRPSLILADEPTGNLDTGASGSVMEALENLNAELNATILMVTHDPFAASYCRRILFIRDGSIHSELRREGSKTSFFEDILGTLRVQGGANLDVAPACAQ